MLTVRIQVIDGTGTFTLSDSQPCRLLTSLTGVTRLQRYYEPLCIPRAPGLSLAGIRLVIPAHALGLSCCVRFPCVHAVATTPVQLRNPRQSGHRFRRKAATDSDRKRPANPNEGGHPV